MELNIINEKENALFKRKEIKGTVETESAPSRTEIASLIAKKFNTPEENIKIKKIESKFGSHTFNIIANIYASKEEKEKIEIKKKKDEAAPAKAEDATPAKSTAGGEPTAEAPKEEAEE